MQEPNRQTLRFSLIDSTIGSRFDAGGSSTGFDYLRIGLSSAICLWHSWWVYSGSMAWQVPLWHGWLGFIPRSFVPLFFALSGFLVAGSLERNKLHHFLALRFLRIFPALAFEVTASAIFIGAFFTSFSATTYFTHPEFFDYFLNVIGIIHVNLPGVFPHNALPGLMNPQLWTIPFELECYLAITVLSIFGLVWKRSYLLLTFSAMTIAAFAYKLFDLQSSEPNTIEGHLPGRLLVLTFLAGVLVYRYRYYIQHRISFGFAAIFLLAIFLSNPNLYYLSPLPSAYIAVWVGLMRPIGIPFGDLSYGVYLFHFPATQVLYAIFPRELIPWPAFAALCLVASALLAMVSWRIVEQPLLKRKRVILAGFDVVVSKLLVMLRLGR